MTRTLPMAVGAFLAAAAVASAQQIISARSGAVHYVEGRVFLGDEAVASKFGQFPEIKENGLLRTAEGRAEVLLTPGVFLRMGENSSVKMITNRLIDTRLELVTGMVLVECVELLKDNAVTFVVGNTAVSLRKHGLYRLDAEPALLRVFSGEALVESGDGRVTVKGGKQLPLGGVVLAEKFDTKTGDPLYRWSRRRSEYLALANISASRSLSHQGWDTSGWRWNPYFGMMTFIPCGRSYFSPFGYTYWSPREVYRVYEPPRRVMAASEMDGRRYNPSLGYSTASRGSGYYGSAPAAAPSSSGAPAAAASPRTSGSASPRESAGGRGR